ncbi:hypothetical protein DPMN_029047 [Dreissena polymorpha]|uniref:Uncharacterized protein n=1 Tax=Dreissena polymorpha TaxID=45954 RepID=A0A9D4LY16_DREPO|nr:hypothetical protein DPMN_029047 [Dreissena polymorpha]
MFMKGCIWTARAAIAKIIKGSGSPYIWTRTPGRKRSASASDSTDTVIISKKVRSGGDSPGDITTDRLADARRTLYGKTPAKVNNGHVTATAGSSTENITYQSVGSQPVDGIAMLLKKLDSVVVEIQNVSSSLSSRIDKLKAEIERKLTDKISQILDKRVTNEFKRVNTSLDERLDTFRADFQSEIDTISSKINSVADTVQQIETVLTLQILKVVILRRGEHSI